MKIGEWYNADNKTIETFRKQGAIISPSAMIHTGAEFCFPVHISPQCQIKENVKIDKFSFLNWNTIIYTNVYIGSFCSIGRGVEIGLAQHPVDWLSTHSFQYNNGWFPDLIAYNFPRYHKHLHPKPVQVGSDVWIGNGAKVLSGLTIGHGAIIAAGAIVTKNVPSYAIVGGVPAKIIKYRFTKEIIKQLLELKWWNFSIEQLKDVSFNQIEEAIVYLKNLKEQQ